MKTTRVPVLHSVLLAGRVDRPNNIKRVQLTKSAIQQTLECYSTDTRLTNAASGTT